MKLLMNSKLFFVALFALAMFASDQVYCRALVIGKKGSSIMPADFIMDKARIKKPIAAKMSALEFKKIYCYQLCHTNPEMGGTMCKCDSPPFIVSKKPKSFS